MSWTEEMVAERFEACVNNPAQVACCACWRLRVDMAGHCLHTAGDQSARVQANSLHGITR